jgi:hypothetical protein
MLSISKKKINHKKTCLKKQVFKKNYYIIPGIPPPPPIGGIGGVSSLMSTKAHSVVKIIPATEAAFSNATRATFFWDQ